MDSAPISPQDKAKVRWYAMRAYKCESKAEEALKSKDGMKYFIPKRYEVRTYHGVKSKRLVPVIPSLVFVHASHDRITEFKKNSNFLQFITWDKSTGREYITIPDHQMENFILVVSKYEEDTVYYTPEEIDIRKGVRVRIHGGKFDNVEGVFMRVKGKRSKRLVVQLDGIMAASVEMHPDLVEIIQPV